MAPEVLERLLRALPPDPWGAGRLLTSREGNEDAAIVLVPAGKALAQRVNFFTPLVNDPYAFGQMAAAAALSDIYAMGGVPWCAMNIVCFPSKSLDTAVLSSILAGGADKVAESGAAMAGGHSVEGTVIQFGLSATGLVDPESFTDKASLQPGDLLVVTGALGAGILAAAIREQYPGSEEREKILSANGTRLDAAAGAVIRRLGLKAAASLTGFGLGGRLLEMLEASDLAASIHAGSITLLPQTRELATQGFSPGNGRAGPSPGHRDCRIAPGIDPVLTDSIFDAQAAGGVILAVPPDTIATALALLAEGGETAQAIGEVVPHRQGLPRLNILA